MQSSLRAFLARLIDYAGLFPPASLSLDAAIRNYAAYQKDGDDWMLGRFIIPASRINELEPYISLFSSSSPLPLSVTGSRSKSAETCLSGLREELGIVADFCSRHKDAVQVNVFEQPLPPAVPDRDLLEQIATETSRFGLQTFCEQTVSLDVNWDRQMVDTLDAIATFNRAADTALGFKLRTGGVTADVFPTPEQVALVLVGCRERGIAMKFTAGLHHPVRMFRDEVDTRMHGFLNVFTAGMLAHVYNLDVQATAEILADEARGSFSFFGNLLSWRNMVLTDSDISRLRKTAFYSYGCCSFDEPRDDLRALKIFSF